MFHNAKAFNMKQIFVLILMFGISSSVFCQRQKPKNIDHHDPASSVAPAVNTEGRNCGTTIYEEHLRSLDPEYDSKKERIFREAKELGASLRGGAVVTIPVVFHIVYNTSTENLSLSQIQSQMVVLNKDFRRTNSDASQTPQVFQGVAADAEIEFCLASVDPNGNATDGITRTQTTRTSFAVPSNVSSSEPLKFTGLGGKDAWNSSKYLNIWVADISSGVLGYATFPGTATAAKDGVVIDYEYFGTTGTATYPFNGGRTCTHEVGHYLGLRHIWGDGNCSYDDNIADTPTSADDYFGCPTHPQSSCGSTDMFMNYMDYVDDRCMNMFTQGQKSVMVGVLQSQRSDLIANATAACGTVTNACNNLAGGPGFMGFEANENTGSWTIEDVNNDGSSWLIAATPTNTTDSGPRTGNKYVRYVYNSYNSADDWIWSNCIDFIDGHEYEVIYWYCASTNTYGTAYDEIMEVGASTSQSVSNLIQIIQPRDTITNVFPNYLQKSLKFSVTGNFEAYIGFHAISDADKYVLQLDDIMIRDITPVANEEVVENTFFKLFPNPASDILHLDITSDKFIEEAEVRIFDMTGKLITNRQLKGIQNDDITFNVSDFSNGIYIVNFISDGKISTEKVVISR